MEHQIQHATDIIIGKIALSSFDNAIIHGGSAYACVDDVGMCLNVSDATEVSSNIFASR